MNIGILSMQKICNYGSFLQAMSLKMQMEARGCNVYFIDILPGRQIAEPEKAEASNGILSKFDKYFFKRIENYLLSEKMEKIHIADYEKHLETSKALPANKRFDLAIIGSDEVFNCTIPSRWGFSTQLFGKIDNADKIVTYAASCGSTTYEKAQSFGITDELKEAMQNLSSISVRDANTSDFVEKIAGIVPEVNVDPVFLSNYDKYIPKTHRKKPYLLVYAYPNRICDESEIAAIKAYAKKNNLDILCVGMQQRWCKHNITANAFELLSYVKNAACIVTDTFHGTVFSIKYNKQFISLIRESNRNKLGGLLNSFELMSRSVDDPNKLESIMNTDINYKKVNEIISLEQSKAEKYLDLIINTGE